MLLRIYREKLQKKLMFQSRSPLTTDLISTSSSIVSPLTTDSLTTPDSGLRSLSFALPDIRAASTVPPNDSVTRFDVRYLQETIRSSPNGDRDGRTRSR